MKKIISNLFIGFTLIPFSISVGERCGSIPWRIFFYAVAIALIIAGSFLFKKEDVPRYTSITILGIGVFIGVITTRDTIRFNKAEKSFRSWADYREELGQTLSRWTIVDPTDSYKKDVITQYAMAENHLLGHNGYPINYALAKDYAQKAADKGNPRGHALLASMYLKGMGCAPDSSQALDNTLLALKDGFEQAYSLATELTKANFTLTSKDSVILAESLNNSHFLDSAVKVLSNYYEINKGREGKDNHYFKQYSEFVGDNKKRLEELSDAGYYRAAEILYFYALTSQDNNELKQYSTVLWNYNRIPDTPFARKLFLGHYFGDEYNKNSSEEEALNKYIENDDYVELAFAKQFKVFKNQYYDYQYNVARFERAKYLLVNRENLNHLRFTFDEVDRLEAGYFFALNSLVDITECISKEMRERPYVLSNTLIK